MSLVQDPSYLSISGQQRQKENNAQDQTLQAFLIPRQKINHVIKSQNQIVEKLAKGTKLQYSSFQSKYLVFKQILRNFRQIEDKYHMDLIKLQQKLNSDEQKRSNDPLQSIEKKKQPKKLRNSTNQKVSKQEKNIFSRQKRQQGGKKAQTYKKRKSQGVNSQVKQIPQGKKLKSEFDSIHDLDDQDLEEEIEEVIKTTNKKKSKNKPGCNFKSYSRFIVQGTEQDEDNTIKEIQRKISQRRTLPYNFSNVSKILLFSYSTVQMVLDYNESITYPYS